MKSSLKKIAANQLLTQILLVLEQQYIYINNLASTLINLKLLFSL